MGRCERPGRVCIFAAIALFAATGCVDVAAWRDDDAIGDAVKHRLYEYGDANLLEVEVSVSNRVVYLSGEADEFSYKDIAGRVARQVDRVVDVVNKVQVEP
jgi:osmotically-inducible protein OsmY